MAPLAIVAGFAAGAYLASISREALIRELEPLKSRYFALAGLFGGGALMPAVLVLYGLFPDWSLMYLANPAHLPGLLVVVWIGLHALAAPPLGFLVVQRSFTAENPWRRRAAALISGGLGLFLLVFGGGRLSTVAYYDAFHAGDAGLSLLRSALFLPLMMTTGAVVSVFVFSVMHTRRHVELGRGVPSRR